MDEHRSAADDTRVVERGVESTTILENEDSEPPIADGAVDRPSPDLLFDLLSDSRRRHALYALLEHDGRADISTLADHVATVEAESGEPVTTDTYSRTYTALYHAHLPKLSDAGMIEYRRGEEPVTLTELAVTLEPYLELAAEDDLVDAAAASL